MSRQRELEETESSFDDKMDEMYELVGPDDPPPTLDEAMSFGTSEDRHIELLDRLERIEELLVSLKAGGK